MLPLQVKDGVCAYHRVIAYGRSFPSASSCAIKRASPKSCNAQVVTKNIISAFPLPSQEMATVIAQDVLGLPSVTYTDLYKAFFAQEDVLRLEVHVQDATAMEKRNCLEQLVHDELDLLHRQSAWPEEKLM